MNVFSWSIPFVAEKVVSILFNMVNKTSGDSDTEDLIVAPGIQGASTLAQVDDNKQTDKDSNITHASSTFQSQVKESNRYSSSQNDDLTSTMSGWSGIQSINESML